MSTPYNEETLPVLIELEILPDLMTFAFVLSNIRKLTVPLTIVKLLFPLLESALFVLNNKCALTVVLFEFLSEVLKFL